MTQRGLYIKQAREMLLPPSKAGTGSANKTVWMEQPCIHTTQTLRERHKNRKRTHCSQTRTEIRAHSHTLRATLTKISALFEQNPNVISRTNSNIHVCAAAAHLHTEYTQCQY